MTLVLTHVSPVGIVMATDSAITFKNTDGSIKHVDHKGWQKLFYIRSLRAGVSYWGQVGAISPRFDEWIKWRIENAHNFSSVREFGNDLARQLNSNLDNRILADPLGIHLAGFESWDDGVVRPIFLHIHNGGGEFRTQLVGSHFKYFWHRLGPAKLFQSHQDFPFVGDLNASLSDFYLKFGRVTRNGDYYMYAHISEALDMAVNVLRAHEGISIPSRPNEIQSWKGYWHITLQNIINIYRVSNLHATVGGKVSSIAFDLNRSYVK